MDGPPVLGPSSLACPAFTINLIFSRYTRMKWPRSHQPVVRTIGHLFVNDTYLSSTSASAKADFNNLLAWANYTAWVRL